MPSGQPDDLLERLLQEAEQGKGRRRRPAKPAALPADAGEGTRHYRLLSSSADRAVVEVTSRVCRHCQALIYGEGELVSCPVCGWRQAAE